MNKNLKIYFAGSIRGGREDVAIYTEMIAFLRTFGEVMTEHVGDLELTEKGDDGPNDRSIYDRDMTWLKACDLVVAEVTRPSLGVGYELGRAVAWNKPALCLFRSDSQKTLSAMVAGCLALKTVQYSRLEEAKQLMSSFITMNSPDPVHFPSQKDGGK